MRESSPARLMDCTGLAHQDAKVVAKSSNAASSGRMSSDMKDSPAFHFFLISFDIRPRTISDLNSPCS